MAYETTILLVTYRRPDSLRRVFAFWKRVGLDRPVMVLDSSPLEEQQVNRATCEQAGLVAPVVYRGFSTDFQPFQKWDAVDGEITTPFINFAADDDFLMPAALDACEDFLRQNPDYVACQGFFLSYLRHGDALRFSEDSFRPSNDGPAVEGRIWKHFNEYGHFTYGLRRASTWRQWPKDLRRRILSLYPDAGALHEIADGMLNLVAGKLKRLPILNTVRNGQPTFEDGWRRTFVFGPHFSEAMTAFRLALIEALNLKAPRPPGDYELLLDEGLSAFFGGSLGRTGKRKLLLETFPNLNSPAPGSRDFRALVESMQFRPEDFRAVLEEIAAKPLAMDLAASDQPVGRSRYHVVRKLDAVATSFSSSRWARKPAGVFEKKLPKILRQPKKSVGAALIRIGEKLGGHKVS